MASTTEDAVALATSPAATGRHLPDRGTRTSRLGSLILVDVSRPARCPSDDGYCSSATI